MIEVVALAGVPGAGKSTVMLEIIKRLGDFREASPFALGLVRGYEFAKAKAMVFGIYDGAPFPGTDRLSMAVQPQAIDFLAHLHGSKEYRGWRVFLEGDRLSTASFLDALSFKRIPFKFYVLEVTPEEQAERFKKRGSNQPATFLQGRATKIARLKARFPHTVIENGDGQAREWASVILRGVEGET